MIAAILRLALISVGALILIVFALFSVRFMGLQQAFAPTPHVWFEQKFWNVYSPPDLCSESVQLTPPTPDWLVLIPVRFKDGEWRLDCPDKNWNLAEMLAKSAHPNWILRVRANDSANLDNLVDIVGSHDRTKKFAIASDSQRVSRFLRKKAPQWLFAADPSSLLRMQMFSSLWIETAMDFWPDFVLAGQDITLPAHLSPRLAKEIERRQKRILWDESFTEQKPDIPIHGIVTTRPSP